MLETKPPAKTPEESFKARVPAIVEFPGSKHPQPTYRVLVVDSDNYRRVCFYDPIHNQWDSALFYRHTPGHTIMEMPVRLWPKKWSEELYKEILGFDTMRDRVDASKIKAKWFGFQWENIVLSQLVKQPGPDVHGKYSEFHETFLELLSGLRPLTARQAALWNFDRLAGHMYMYFELALYHRFYEVMLLPAADLHKPACCYESKTGPRMVESDFLTGVAFNRPAEFPLH